MNEAAVQGTVVDALRVCGWRFVHFRPALTKSGKWVTPYTGDDGFPDIIALKGTVQLALECKGTKGARKPGPNVRGSELKRLIRYEQQEEWIRRFADTGAVALFVGPDNLVAVLRMIQAYGTNAFAK